MITPCGQGAQLERYMNRFKKWLLDLVGMRIWPEKDDPRIKGPPSRILTRRQWEAMEKSYSENQDEDNVSHVS